MTARPVPFGVRYGRLRLDGDLDEFHKALAYLKADTCERGRCDPIGDGRCSKHQRRERRWRQAEDVGTGGRL